MNYRELGDSRTLNTVLVSLVIIGISVLGVMLINWNLQIGLLLIVAIFGILITLIKPVIGLYFLVATFPLEIIIVTQSDTTWTRLIGLAVFGAWITRKLVNKESFKGMLTARHLPQVSLFLLWSFVSVLWAQYPANIGVFIVQMLQLLGLSLIVIDLCKNQDILDNVLKMLVLGATFAALLTINDFLVNSIDITKFRAGDNIAGNENGTALVLSVTLPVAVYLLSRKPGGFWFVVLLTFLFTTPVAIALTQSRASYILFPILFVLTTLLARGKKTSGPETLLLLFVTIAVSTVIWLFFGEVVTQRLGTVLTYIQDEGPRVDHWLGGLAIYADHPFLGVGINNFGYHFRDTYQFMFDTVRQYNTLRSPHSTVFGIMAELGTVGILLWVALHMVIISAAYRAQKLPNIGPALKILLRIMLTTLLVYGLYGVVAVVDTQKTLWLFFGITLAAVALANRYQQHDNSDPAQLDVVAP